MVKGRSPPKSPAVVGKLRRCNWKTSPVHAVKLPTAATAVKSRARPLARSSGSLGPKPAAELPLPLHASESSDRWTMLKRLFMWPTKMLDDYSDHMLPTKGCDDWMMIASSLVDELGLDSKDMPLPNNAFAIEKHKGCQQELLGHPHAAEHVFGDLEEFWDPSIKAKLSDIEDKGLEDSILLPLITSGKAVVRKGWCIRHGRYCQVVPTKLHVAGTSCVDYSLRGEGQGAHGPTRRPFWVWCGMRCDLEEDAILHENVVQFQEQLLSKFLGHLYHVDKCSSCCLNPSEYGFPVERARKYTILRHKLKTKGWKMPWNIFTSIFQTQHLMGFSFPDDRPHWDVWFCASSIDLWKEYQWAANRPESRANGMTLKWDTFEAFKRDLEDPSKAKEMREEFDRCLTTVESNFLCTYRANNPGLAYSLNQNPEFSQTDSSFTSLHTVIRNAGVIWSDSHGRWLTSQEALMAQSFPVYKELTSNRPLCSFAIPAGNPQDSEYRRTAMIEQAGNAMHAMIVGMGLLYAATQLESTPQQFFSTSMMGIVNQLFASGL